MGRLNPHATDRRPVRCIREPRRGNLRGRLTGALEQDLLQHERRLAISTLEALFLGALQGLTEFIPVSSSGHLVFFQSLFGLKEAPLFFDVMLHFGTLMAVLITFRHDVAAMGSEALKALRGKKGGLEGKLLFWIVLGTIPTGLMGILLKDWFESFFTRPKSVGAMILITGSLLWLTRWIKGEGRSLERMTWLDAVVIGVAQGVAIMPGISRSGTTISVALYLGLNRELAGRFSFLLSIPAILGATLLEIPKLGVIHDPSLALIGAVTAFGVGYVSLKFLMRMIKLGWVGNFAYYCWAAGIAMVVGF